MRTCFTCPLYSKLPNGEPVCYSTHPDMHGVGCKCYLPFKAMTSAPHAEGCYGRTLDEDLGWPAYRFRDWGERLGCIIDFIMHPPDNGARTIQPQGRPGQI